MEALECAKVLAEQAAEQVKASFQSKTSDLITAEKEITMARATIQTTLRKVLMPHFVPDHVAPAVHHSHQQASVQARCSVSSSLMTGFAGGSSGDCQTGG